MIPEDDIASQLVHRLEKEGETGPAMDIAIRDYLAEYFNWENYFVDGPVTTDYTTAMSLLSMCFPDWCYDISKYSEHYPFPDSPLAEVRLWKRGPEGPIPFRDMIDSAAPTPLGALMAAIIRVTVRTR